MQDAEVQQSQLRFHSVEMDHTVVLDFESASVTGDVEGETRKW